MGISGIGDGLAFLRVTKRKISLCQMKNTVLGSLEFDVAQAGIRNVPDKDPADFEDTLPLVRSPNSAASRVVDWSQHLCHATEVTRRVDTEEEVNRTASGSLLESLIEPLVARISGTPDFILQRFVNIVFRV